MEGIGWLAALALLSPLVLYAGRDVPIPILYGVAAGIAISLMLAGRRLYDVLLDEGLRGRGGTLRLIVAFGLVLLGFAAVLLGAVFVLAVALSGRAPKLPI